jgi:hypothetical protein
MAALRLNSIFCHIVANPTDGSFAQILCQLSDVLLALENKVRLHTRESAVIS